MVAFAIPAAIGAGLGLLINPDDPLKGAATGAAIGAGGAALPGLLAGSGAAGAAAGGAGAGGIAAGGAAPIVEAAPSVAGGGIPAGDAFLPGLLADPQFNTQVSTNAPQGFFQRNENALVGGAISAAPQFLPEEKPPPSPGSLSPGQFQPSENLFFQLRRKRR